MVNKSIVYLFEYGNLTKIGITSNLVSRLQAINAQSPVDVICTHICECEYAREVELEIHTEYAHKRHHGEWFSLSESDIEQIKNEYNFIEHFVPRPPRRRRCIGA